MTIAYFIFNLCYNIFLILSSDKKIALSRKELFLTYLKLQFRYLFFVLLIRKKFSRENLFGYEINFSNYSNPLFMFEEVFISKVYYFKAKKNNPFIFDCGANIGLAIFFFKKLYPKSEIIAFEPDGEAFPVLKRNIEDNNLKNIQLINKALNNKDGEVKFYFSLENPNSFSKSIIKERVAEHNVFKKVFAVKLSNYIKKKIDFLKLDVEGAENLVIDELDRERKLGLVEQLVLEFHHHIEPKKDNFCAILNILEKNGYGYQIRSSQKTPFVKEQFQDILVYAYKK